MKVKCERCNAEDIAMDYKYCTKCGAQKKYSVTLLPVEDNFAKRVLDSAAKNEPLDSGIISSFEQYCNFLFNELLLDNFTNSDTLENYKDEIISIYNTSMILGYYFKMEEINEKFGIKNNNLKITSGQVIYKEFINKKQEDFYGEFMEVIGSGNDGKNFSFEIAKSLAFVSANTMVALTEYYFPREDSKKGSLIPLVNYLIMPAMMIGYSIADCLYKDVD